MAVEDEADGHITADEMDENRKKQMAYEYLCHLEEAKKSVISSNFFTFSVELSVSVSLFGSKYLKHRSVLVINFFNVNLWNFDAESNDFIGRCCCEMLMI